MSPPTIHRRIVLVAGAPGSGKSTLARPLAAALSMPLLSKDMIKEAITDALGPGDGSIGASRPAGAAAMEVLWTLAAHAPCAVLEANFRPGCAYERDRMAALGAGIVEVHCECGAEEAARRFAARARRGAQHAAHPMTELPAALLAEYASPMDVGPLIRVDTRQPVDIAALAPRVAATFTKG
ncbi:MAG: AAA family ATPase [Pseudomonadota bacterium]